MDVRLYDLNHQRNRTCPVFAQNWTYTQNSSIFYKKHTPTFSYICIINKTIARMKKFAIEKPKPTTGYFILFLKYTTLLIVTWIAAWLFLLFILAKPSASSSFGNMVLNNLGEISLIIAFLVIGFYVKKIIDNYKLGSPYSFEFSDNTLTIETMNLLNGKSNRRTIPFSKLSINEHRKDNELIGKNRIIEIYDNQTLITIIKIDQTAWCRYEGLEDLLFELKTKQVQK